MSARAESFLYLWDGRLFWATPENVNEPHAHFSTAILLSLDRPFELQVSGGEYRAYTGAVVRSNVPLAVRARGANLVFHIDPDMPDYAPIRAALDDNPLLPLAESGFRRLKPSLREALAGPLSCARAGVLFDEVLAMVAAHADSPPIPLDPRLAEITRRLRAELPDRISVHALAASVGLSPSWLMHLFKGELGLTLRQYLRYLKIRKGACLLAAGWPLAEMSVAAGFADQAHASRTVQRTYGLNPSHFAGSTHLRLCDSALAARWEIGEYPHGSS